MTTKKTIRLVLADDHEFFRDGFKAMIRKEPALELAGEASNGEELVAITRELKPAVVVTDIKMPKMDGLQATRIIASEFPETGIIALSMIDEENLIIDMLEAGARGYLLKNAHKEEIREAIFAVSEGQTYFCDETTSRLTRVIAKNERIPLHKKERRPEFSAREIEVIQYICEELTNREIADRMHLSVRTIEGHRDKIHEKIGARNAVGVVVYAIRNNLYKV